MPHILQDVFQVVSYEPSAINIKLFSLIVISLETPILPVKQWEEHLKLREMVEKIRKRQAGM